MTSISNLFSNLTGSTKTINDHAREYKEYKENKKYLNDTTPAINQGEKFKRYQKKIKKNLEKQTKNFKYFSEGFENIEDNLHLSNDGLTVQTNNVIQNNDYTSQQSTIDSLRQQYQSSLTEYENLIKQISGDTSGYLDRVNPNNPYLGKNINIGGNIMYVTRQGVAKWYSPDAWNSCPGKKGCPPQSELITIDVPWKNEYYNTSGLTIPSNPPLVTGTPMQPTESCGSEGANVYVSEMITNPGTPAYQGTFADNPISRLMSFIGGAPPPPTGSIQNGNFAQPQIANDSYQYISSSSTVPGWIFNPAVLINNSAAWGYPMPYPSGSQAACIQGTQAFGQYIQLSSGTYTLTFYACGRPTNEGANTINVYCVPAGQNANSVYTFTPPTTAWQKYTTTFNIQNSGNYAFGFSGTANTGDKSTAVQNIQLTPGSDTGGANGYYDFQKCLTAAVDEGYRYFGLQNVNPSTSTGYCGVSNDQPTITKLGAALTPGNFSAVWASNTANSQTSGTAATLTNQGSLAVYSSSGERLFYTDYSKSQPNNYLGCYGDSPNRAMPLYNGGSQEYNLQQCQQIAQQNGAAYFGLQNSTSGTTAQCALSNNFAQTTEFGPAGNCTQLSDGTWSGGGWSNAVYNTNNPSSNYFLVLQDDGNLVVYRGTSPIDNQGLIWASGTDGKQKDANPDWVASKGKYGRNFMTQGSVLAAGDWIGNNTGTMQLIMQSDGNLVLYVCGLVPNTKQIADGKVGGGPNANAIYDIGETGYKNNIGKVAYIDENASLHMYPTSNIQYSDTYQVIQNYNSGYNDIPGAAYGNASSPDACKATCNNIPECAGFAWQKTGNVCWPKTSAMYPNGPRQNDPDLDIYIRNKSPISTPIGVPHTTNPIDTVTWQSYVNGGDLGTSYGLANATAAQKAQLEQLQSQMNLLSNQISEFTGKFGDGSKQVDTQSKANIAGLQDYLTGLQNTNDKITGITSDGNINSILKDSDIVVLQKNYDYLFWSILASGTVLLAMNIVKNIQ